MADTADDYEVESIHAVRFLDSVRHLLTLSALSLPSSRPHPRALSPPPSHPLAPTLVPSGSRPRAL